MNDSEVLANQPSTRRGETERGLGLGLDRSFSFSDWLTERLEVFSPRKCAVCGCRLMPSERTVCGLCVMDLPVLGWAADVRGNAMARHFWLKMEAEGCYAFLHHKPHSDAGNLVYRLKYCHDEEVGLWMGHTMGRDLVGSELVRGIDFIVPAPLAPKRVRQRGYNQSELIAKGMGEVLGLPVRTDIVVRDTFFRSQASLSHSEREANVSGAFRVVNAEALQGRHVLLLDDVVTTGATMLAFGQEVLKAGDVRVSVASWGFAM